MLSDGLLRIANDGLQQADRPFVSRLL